MNYEVYQDCRNTSYQSYEENQAQELTGSIKLRYRFLEMVLEMATKGEKAAAEVKEFQGSLRNRS